MELYGYHPPSITSLLEVKVKVQAMEEHIEHQHEVLKLLKDNLVIAQNTMKQQVDQNHNEREFDGLGISKATTIQTYVLEATKEGQ
jgi:hypothetical protein